MTTKKYKHSVHTIDGLIEWEDEHEPVSRQQQLTQEQIKQDLKRLSPSP